MKTEFDNIGKREPYTVPAGFYESLERKIIAGTVGSPKKKRNTQRWILTAISSAAAIAVIVIMFAMPKNNYAPITPCSIEDVEMRFAQLQPSDRDYLIETYEEDIFLSQITEE